MASGDRSDPASAQRAPRRLQGPRIENRITRAFSLQSDPFTAQHDARFIVGSKPMRQALARLRKCLEERCQLILISGEAGIGKTALLDAIQRDSQPDGRMARIDDPTRGWAEIGQEIGSQIHLDGGRLSPGAVVTERGHGRTLRIFIDSAQCLPEDSLNHLKAYLELQAPPGKNLHHLQLILLARNTAPAPVFGWLRKFEHQRIGFDRLDSAESRRYVRRRLRVAAGEDRRIFTEEALDRVAQVTDGLPGAINQMCHVALDMAASRELAIIESPLVEEVYERLQESRARHRKLAIAARAAAAADAAAAREASSAAVASPAPEPPGTAPASIFAGEVEASAGEGAAAPSAREDAGEGAFRRAAETESSGLLLDEIDEPADGAGHRAVVTHTPHRSSWRLALVSALLGALAALLLLGLWNGGFGLFDEPAPSLPAAVLEPTPLPEPPVEEEVAVVEEPMTEELVALVEPPPVEEVAVPAPEPKPPAAPQAAPKPEPKPKPEPAKVVRAPRPRRTEPAPTVEVAPRPEPPARVPPPPRVASIPTPAQAKPTTLGASEVLERAFGRFYDSGQTRTVEMFEHADSDERPVEIFKLARKQLPGRTLSLGVLVGAGDREEQRILSIETGDPQDKRFAYLPGPKKTVNLSESGGLEPFDGTHFRYDDFRPASLERYTVYGQEKSEGAGRHFTLVSAKPRHRAPYSRVEFLIDTSDYMLIERHYYRGSGLRPYRIVQTPRENMKSVGKQIVPMRFIARDLKTGRIAEAKVVDLDLVGDLDNRLFTLSRIRQPELRAPNF